MTDSELLEQFEAATLGAEDFPHREHVHLAWVYLTRGPLLDVLERFPRHLRALATALGAVGLYHETITWFLLMLVHDRIARYGSGECWEAFATKNGDLLDESSAIMDRNYCSETWRSAVAKERFLLPDGTGPRRS